MREIMSFYTDFTQINLKFGVLSKVMFVDQDFSEDIIKKIYKITLQLSSFSVSKCDKNSWI